MADSDLKLQVEGTIQRTGRKNGNAQRALSELCPSFEGPQLVFRCPGGPQSKHRRLELLLQLVDLTIFGTYRRPKPKGEDICKIKEKIRNRKSYESENDKVRTLVNLTIYGTPKGKQKTSIPAQGMTQKKPYCKENMEPIRGIKLGK